MKFTYFLLAVSNLLVTAITATVGLSVEGTVRFEKHFLLGVLTGLFTCLLHTVGFMYFAVQGKIMQQAAVGGLSADLHRETIELKARALHVSLTGIGAILVVIALGAASGLYLAPEFHLVAGFANLFLQGALAVRQYGLIDRYYALFARAFGER